MEINLNNTYYGAVNIQTNINKDLKADIAVKDNKPQEQTYVNQKINQVKNFASLCKQFPDIAFVVVDYLGSPVPEYNGICNTAAFGDLNKVSIRINEEVIEKLDEDFDNIIKMIQYKEDTYSYVKDNAEISGCKTTAADLCYDGTKLIYMQVLWPDYDAPDIYRKTGSLKPSSSDYTNIDLNEKYLQDFLLNMQHKTYDKLFKLGESDKDEVKSRQKYVEKYQKHFLYRKQF